MRSLFVVCLVIAAASSHASDVALGDIKLKDFPTFPNKTRKESAEILGDTIRVIFKKKLLLMGDILVDKGQEAPNKVEIELKKFRQVNRSPGEVMNAPNKPASETTVLISLLLQTPNGSESAEKLEGKFGGQHFGTTDRYELSGNPEDKALMINLVVKNRAEAIALAIWNAVEPVIRKAKLA